MKIKRTEQKSFHDNTAGFPKFVPVNSDARWMMELHTRMLASTKGKRVGSPSKTIESTFGKGNEERQK